MVNRKSIFQCRAVGPVHDPRSPPGHWHDVPLGRGHLRDDRDVSQAAG